MTKKMNPSIKGRWLHELRSGKYEQGRSFLKQKLHDGTEKFCCLGVLCEIYSKAHPGDMFDLTAHRSRSGDVEVKSFLGVVNQLPIPVMEWSEIGNTLGSGIKVTLKSGDTMMSSLATLNDSGWTFEKIAEVIEAEL